jgi:membrane protease subunit HflK
MLFLPLDKIMQQAAQGGAAAPAAAEPLPATGAPPVTVPTPGATTADPRARENARGRERESR